MDTKIAKLNIQRFRGLLAENIDDAKRRTVIKLLHEEEEKLRALQDAQEPDEPEIAV